MSGAPFRAAPYHKDWRCMSQGSEWKPTVYHDTVEYWRGCERSELVIARCDSCETWIHPPRAVCPKCWSDDVGHYPVAGKAKVYSYASIPSPSRFGATTTLWAELVEQDRLIVVADLDPATPDVAIGDDLEVAWREQGAGRVPIFRKVGA